MDMKWIALAITVLMYAFVIAFPKKKAYASLSAAALLVFLGAVSPARALGTHVNWNVLAVFVGSLIMADLFIYSRVPERVADAIVNRSRDVGVAIVSILVMTGLISAFVENVATVLVMAPIALALCAKTGIKPTYFLTGLAVMANLQGTATLVGDSPSLIFASFAGYTFNDFFVYRGTLSIFFIIQTGMLAGAAFFYAHFARERSGKITLERTSIVSPFPAILLVSMISTLALVSFLGFGAPPSSGIIVSAHAAIGLAWFRLARKESASRALDVIKRVDWDAFAFLVGIFVVVGAIADQGLLADLSSLLSRAIGDHVLVGFIAIIAVSLAVSGFVDNVPYIVAMLPVAANLSSSLGINGELYLFALLVGSCLGGNLTPFGASSNVVASGILGKQGVPMTFGAWLKIGLPFTLITTIASSAVLWLLWGP
jgi:Na+/H+ antiporter NhaD/arsenite permease-like protein